MLRVTPIYGSRWEEKGPAPLGNCTLIEYAEVKVLVNIGGPISDFDWHNQLPEHDCVVLTDSTVESMGSLPLYHRSPNSTTSQVYATFPTVKMGQMSLYDHHANLCLDGARPAFLLQEMDQAFSELQTIKYSQTLLLPRDKPRLSITAYRAGHVVGGAFYVLQRLQDETSVVVTSTYHIAKELHLDSSTLLQYGATPDVLVTSPGGPAMKLLGQLYATKKIAPPLVTQSQRNLVEHILSVLRRDGNVLLPVDASGRILELVLLLSQHWERHRLEGAYNLVWLGPMVANTIDFCRAQLEWMAISLGNQFDSPGKGHPYALKSVQLCTSVAELESILSNGNPTCVMSSGASLDHGPARDLLLRWADNDNNAILFTDSSQCHVRPWKRKPTVKGVDDMAEEAAGPSGPATPKAPTAAQVSAGATAAASNTAAAAAAASEQEEEAQEDTALGAAITEEEASEYTTSYQLLQHWCKAKLEDREMEDSVEVDVLVPRRAPLAGPELKQFMEEEEAARLSKRKLEEEQAMLREVELAKGRLRLGEEQQQQTTAAPPSAADTKTDYGSSSKTPTYKFTRPKKKSRFDSSLFLKFSKPLHLTFEVREDAVGVGQKDSTAKYGIGESVGNSGVLEDDYGIAVIPEHFVDIVTGVDPSKFAGGSGRIGEEVLRRGFGFGNVDAAAEPSQKGSGENGDDEGEGMDERGLEAADLSEGRGIIRGRGGRPPTKIFFVPRLLQVFAEIDYFPLEGRVDSRAARQSVRALQPRQVVVLGGRKPPKTDESAPTEDSNEKTKAIDLVDEVESLANAAQSFLTTDRPIQTPSDMDTVELAVGHAAYSVRLIATPYRTAEEKAKEEEPPAAIELRESKLGACTVSFLDYVATGKRVALDGSIVLAPKKRSKQQPSIYVSDGEVLLTDLRAELIAQGMKAEYSAHQGYSKLVVNHKVVVKKDSDSGRMAVEGPLCEDFFTVRSVVCGQYVTL